MFLYRARSGSGLAVFRVVAFFFSTHIGRILAGSVFLLSGLIYGFASHTVVYQQNFSGDYSGVLDFHDASYYLQPNGSGDKYFIIKIEDFTPQPADLTTQGKKLVFTSLTYRNDSQKIDKQYNDGTPSIVGTGYQVVAFTLADSDGTQQQYTITEYREHPRGFYEDRWWGYGIIGVILGLLFFGLTLLVYWLDKRAAARALGKNP